MPRETLAKVKAKQERRSPKARGADSGQTAKRTVGQLNKKGMEAWLKDPRRVDVAGVDTKSKGKAPKKVKLYPGKKKPAPAKRKPVSLRQLVRPRTRKVAVPKDIVGYKLNWLKYSEPYESFEFTLKKAQRLAAQIQVLPSTKSVVRIQAVTHYP